MSKVCSQEEFDAWKDHPVTRAVREVLAKKREELRQAWEGGSFTDYDTSTTALMNVGNIGTCRGYAYVQELTYEQLIGELND